jgi:hypothetical protein
MFTFTGKEWLASIIVMLIIGIMGGIGIGLEIALGNTRQRAVDVGVGKWVADQKTGRVCFYWIVGTNLVAR